MVADLNHGKSEKGSTTSSSSRSSHKPYRDIWVTSTAEVALPGMGDLRKMTFNDCLGLPQLHGS